MRPKFIFILIIAFLAYVLGAKAGRARYKQISKSVKKFWNDPQVKKARGRAKKELAKAEKAANKKVKSLR
ncbi:hypothetical protein ACUWEX_13685 [Okibacterium fritillariae]|uniref:Uncharacterized protein n=1 Tax=Okibacterium fritillariae TaxID=123320 RepID=A0A1T5KYJ7_9MICO|nr:hypothetical protein [Okibacterium fritillariae]SKC68866.1 hypothetical protein SAMN06309945_2700 [Okibacterium fritillariae]